MRHPIRKYFGPSTLVTAAFIGPGTLTVCTLAGANFGYQLLWVLVFATLGTLLMQEMAARMGLITQLGLGENFRKLIHSKLNRFFLFALILLAIGVGNAAYQAGNLAGAQLGLSSIGPSSIDYGWWVGGFALLILWFGKIEWIQRLLVVLVGVMSIVFVATAVLVGPNLKEVLGGFIPSIAKGQSLTVLALIGTTMVPYNLFLHASSVSSKWKRPEELADLRKENAVAIILGGLVSMSIVVASGATLFGSQTEVTGLPDMAKQLVPLLGDWAHAFLAVGLFSAGLSSALTAPLAAAYAAKGVFGWSDNEKYKFRAVWLVVLGIGWLFTLIGYQPLEVIRLAQVANGLLLPVVAGLLLFASNKSALLGKYVNTTWQNIWALLAIAVCLLVSIRSFNSVFHFL